MSEEKKSENKDDSTSPNWLLLTAAVGLVLMILSTVWLVVPKIYPESEMQGQFGDMFGGANALFSGCAFVAIIYTIYLQKLDLNRQYEFMKTNRKIERARYRKDVLPKFSIDNSGEETGKRQNGYIEVKVSLTNLRHEIYETTFTQLRGNIPLEIKIGDVKYSYIKKDEIISFEVWYPENESSTQIIDITFETVDNVKWNNRITLQIHENEIIHDKVGKAKQFIGLEDDE
ncbi:hypothetical protein [Gimesia maris]|uniref:hypothetical protein n=1 Tax=Gimesia maris TaxID=122 RepID=UPI0030DB8DD2|tara:strand:- start:842 stop:1531 length:690 start_codon:yes stop_codon:yes gene_type:complete